jgi:hypothetical protein
MRRLLLRSTAFVPAARRFVKKHPQAVPVLQIGTHDEVY